MLRFSAFIPTTCLALCVLSAGATADAKAKKKKNKKAILDSVCNLGYLPVEKGLTWKYEYVIPPNYEENPGALKTKVPESFEIEVIGVDPKTKSANLIERYRDVERETSLTCSDKGMMASLDSFFFAGELPGAIGMSVENPQWNGQMFPEKKGFKTGDIFFVELKTDIRRSDTKAPHPVARLELERELTIGKREEVETPQGTHRAYQIKVALSGRTRFPPATKESSLPSGNAAVWFQPKVGIVRAYNRQGQGWELTSVTRADGNPL